MHDPNSHDPDPECETPDLAHTKAVRRPDATDATATGSAADTRAGILARSRLGRPLRLPPTAPKAPDLRPRVLIVENDEGDLGWIRGALAETGADWCVATFAPDAAAAIALGQAPAPDAILLAWEGEDATLGTLRRLREEHPSCAILVMTAAHETPLMVRTLQGGAEECFAKRCPSGRALRTMIRAAIERARLAAQIAGETRERVRRLQSMLRIDEATGLGNAMHFQTRLEQEHVRALRYKRSLAVVVARVDGFDSIVDGHGPECAEMALAAVAKAIVEGVRRIDVCARLEGPEFGIVLVEAVDAQARVAMERVRSALSADLVPLPSGGEMRVTLSCGVGGWTPAISAPDQLVAIARDAMLRATREGGDRILLAAGATNA